MKFSVITPVRNGEKYIAETLESVLSQRGDFTIEHLIMDSVSTDKTAEIVNFYKEKIEKKEYPIHCNGVEIIFVSEKDTSPCDAVRKGIAHATGDICSGLGSDDLFLPGALEAVAKCFRKFPEVEWLTGISASMNADSALYDVGMSRLYHQPWLARGVYGRNAYWIPYEATFWRRSLLQKIAPLDPSLKVACDYSQWVAFAKHTPLYSLEVSLDVFRVHPAQVSSSLTLYNEEKKRIAKSAPYDKLISLFFLISSKTPRVFETLLPYLYILMFGRHKFKSIQIDEDGEPRIVTTNFIRIAHKKS